MNWKKIGASPDAPANSDWGIGDNLVSIRATAERLGLCDESVRLKIKAGELPSFKIGRRRMGPLGGPEGFRRGPPVRSRLMIARPN